MTLLRSGSATDTGLVRSVNQDLAVESPNLFAVADGMGGHAGGEVAAQLAVDTLANAFGRQPTGAGLSQAVTEANSVVWEHSLDHPDLRGMGTTLAAVALVNEDDHDVLALVNVGDSRVYRFHDGELSQITDDHSLAEEMVKTGELTSAEAAVHPHRHILTRALGANADVSVDLWRIQPARGDRFLLCSDGLTNELEDAEIAEVLCSVSDPREAADLLVRAARSHGGSDNITAVVVDVVVGDADDNGAPAIAAVSADFRTATSVVADGAIPLSEADVPQAPVEAGSQPSTAAQGQAAGETRRPWPQSHHPAHSPLRAHARRLGGRRPRRRPLVQQQLVLRGRRPQRAGHLPRTGRRVPLVPPGPGPAHRRDHRGRPERVLEPAACRCRGVICSFGAVLYLEPGDHARGAAQPDEHPVDGGDVHDHHDDHSSEGHAMRGCPDHHGVAPDRCRMATRGCVRSGRAPTDRRTRGRVATDDRLRPLATREGEPRL